jgi:hypothetical protein
VAYSTDGSSHRNGTKAEREVVKLINEDDDIRAAFLNIHEKDIGNFQIAEVRGGTQRTEDYVLLGGKGDILVSHKERKSGGGTFDYLNTSRLGEYEEFSSLRAYFVEKRHKYRDNPREGSRKKKAYRLRLRNKTNLVLSNLSSAFLRELLGRCFKKYGKDNNIVFAVGNTKKRELTVFPAYRMAIHEYLADPNRYDLRVGRPKSGAKTSRQIFVFDKYTGHEINTNLRLRLMPNNGVGAWIGGKSLSSSTSCSLVLKVQQDNVNAMLEEVSAYSISVNY